jgi:hypothetical protein
MSVSEFYDATPRDLYNYLAGRRDAMQFEIEQGWDYVRHVMFAAISPYAPKGNSLKPETIIPLERDKGRTAGPPSEWMKQRIREWEAEQDEIMSKIPVKKPR